MISVSPVEGEEKRRRRAVATAIIAGLVALGFYVGFFLFMHWARR